MTPAVEVTELTKYYGGRAALDGIDLAIAPGEIFGLLGPNGAGKTTTVEILEGYREPDLGGVRVLGLDPRRDAAQLRPQIGVMLQEGGLYPGVKAAELLRLFAAFYADPDDPDRLLDVVGLREVAGTMIRRLSGGQAQRLSLAAALIGRPRLVFLDEPTAGMDPRARADTWDLIRGLRDHGTTVLLTTHFMDEAEQLCDRLAILDHGRIVAAGSPSELTGSLADRAVRFRAGPPVDAAGLAAHLGDAVVETRTGEYAIAGSPSPALIVRLAEYLRDHGSQLTELHTGRASLEEVFLRLTEESAAPAAVPSPSPSSGRRHSRSRS